MFELTSNDTLITSLACAALSSGLRSLLVFDAPYTGLQQLATLLEQFLTQLGHHTQYYHLSSFEIDDDLWGSLELPGGQRTNQLFSPECNKNTLQILTIADLSALSLSMTRTCIMLIGADIAHLERNAEHASWHPEQCWIASCPREAVGTVSPHLLDRFALRLSWQDIAPHALLNQSTKVADLLANVPRQSVRQHVILPTKYLQQISQAICSKTEVTSNALAHMLDYISTEQYYPRREFALARFSLALAQWMGDAWLTPDHVDEAAQMLGLTNQINEQEEQKKIDLLPTQEAKPGEKPSRLNPESTTTILEQRDLQHEQPVRLPETTFTDTIVSSTICQEPYPEDTSPVEREAASLKMPPTRYAPCRSTRGPILGVEESDTLHDLAIVSTILAAARFQYIRGRIQRQAMKFEPMDLRRYRRGYVTEQILMLVLDYTSVRNIPDWQNPLITYLQDAYTKRAGVEIIKVGAHDATTELRAELVSAKSILVPRIGMALESERGRASPLAHGMNLALEQLHHLLEHGRNRVNKATFVVVSDGRGNIPLVGSLRNHLDSIVTNEGIADTLRVAQQIKALKRVDKVVLSPQPRYYPELPNLLAEVLGAILKPLPKPDDTSEDRL